jgi:hypothetical protein
LSAATSTVDCPDGTARRSLASLVSAEASLPLGWRLSGLYRFEETWIGLAEGPGFQDYASGSGLYAEQALRRLSNRLRERRGPTTG